MALQHRAITDRPYVQKIYLSKITSKSIGATIGRPRKTMKLYVIYGFYLANKHHQTCRDRRPRLSGPYNKFYVIYGGYLSSVVGVDVLDDPITYRAVETALRHWTVEDACPYSFER